MPPYVADRRLYLDRSGRVVGEGDPSRHCLLAVPGDVIDPERAAVLGLVARPVAPAPPPPTPKVEPAPTPPTEPAPPRPPSRRKRLKDSP